MQVQHLEEESRFAGWFEQLRADVLAMIEQQPEGQTAPRGQPHRTAANRTARPTAPRGQPSASDAAPPPRD
eukprot:SAG22_NODE_18497_length_286_cov_0.844920_1_plen_70_part_01